MIWEGLRPPLGIGKRRKSLSHYIHKMTKVFPGIASLSLRSQAKYANDKLGFFLQQALAFIPPLMTLARTKQQIPQACSLETSICSSL